MIQPSELWHQQKCGISLATQCEENDWDCEKLVLVVVHCVSAMLSLGRGGFCWALEERNVFTVEYIYIYIFIIYIYIYIYITGQKIIIKIQARRLWSLWYEKH